MQHQVCREDQRNDPDEQCHEHRVEYEGEQAEGGHDSHSARNHVGDEQNEGRDSQQNAPDECEQQVLAEALNRLAVLQ